MILGVGGKMGPTLAMLAKRCIDAGNLAKTVYGVDLFPDPTMADRLQGAGIETIGKLTGQTTGQAFLCMLSAGLVVTAMTFFKLPVSTSQAVIGAVINFDKLLFCIDVGYDTYASLIIRIPFLIKIKRTGILFDIGLEPIEPCVKLGAGIAFQF